MLLLRWQYPIADVLESSQEGGIAAVEMVHYLSYSPHRGDYSPQPSIRNAPGLACALHLGHQSGRRIQICLNLVRMTLTAVA